MIQFTNPDGEAVILDESVIVGFTQTYNGNTMMHTGCGTFVLKGLPEENYEIYQQAKLGVQDE